MRWRGSSGVRWLEASLPGATAAFTTRAGGVSPPPYESLNLGLLTEDERASVLENRRRLTKALGLDPRAVASARQVHGAELAVHTQGAGSGSFIEPAELPEVDGHVLTGPGTAGLVFVADCLPVAVAGPGGAAILHCGWRGLAAGILRRGAEAVGATHAAIGPGIGGCCYEVGPEVLGAFQDLEGVASGGMLDLAEAARQLLEQAGVEAVSSAGLCTSCEPELFFSHRRDGGRTGRQAGLVWLEGEG